MDVMPAVALFAAGLLTGAGIVYLMLRQVTEARSAQAAAAAGAEGRAATGRAEELASRLTAAEGHLREREGEVRTLSEQLVALKADRATFDARLEELGRMQQQMKDTFASLAAQTLKTTSESFFQVAKGELEGIRSTALRDLDDKEKAFAALITPIREGLQKYDARIEQLARERDESMGRITGQLARVEQASAELASQTQQLSRALRSPAVRGRWGEMQLRRVIEIAGMVEHCDFRVQQMLEGDGGRLRPDVVVKLPGGRAVAVDAKVPLTAYLDALEEPQEDARRQKLKQHAVQVRAHAEQLGKKNYWEQMEESLEFVVLFLPSEVFFSAALEHDGKLIEESFTKNRVIIATPTTLIALLHAVAYGWRQEALARSAADIAELGRELYERLSKFDDYIGDVGVHLGRAMDFYNKAVGSLESRVLVSARKFKDLGIGSSVAELAVLEPIEAPTRALRSPELTDGVT